MRTGRLLALGLSIASAAAAAVVAAEVRLPPPGSSAWHDLEFPKIPKHTLYEVVQADGVPTFKATADCSASAMYVAAESIDLQATPILRWRWKVDQGLEVADERVKAGDDFAARVYVMFRFDAEHASWWGRLRHALAQRYYGRVVPGDAISYVWSSHASVGSRWKNPYTAASQIIVEQSGLLEGWAEARADVAADYRASFGRTPPAVLSVAVMSDADDTCQRAVAYFADLRFTGGGEA